MAYIFTYKNFIFIEGFEPTAQIIKSVKYEKLFSFNSQSKTIDCVKDQFIEKAKLAGGNAIVDFTYGQKSSGWFLSSLFALDDNIKWYGSGKIAILPEERIKEILNNLK